jgi:nitrogen regulatory protein PII
MFLKLIIALVEDGRTDEVLKAARDAGCTGATVITSVRGEGLKPSKTFLGLDLSSHRDVLLFIVAAPKARAILETIAAAGKMDEEPGAGVAIQLSIEDAVGMQTQLPTLLQEIEDEV